ncbi:MAG: hypothetical protein A2046_06945 [Bacteroidetes bacterium GWA2_30_7]|nr:MAG: hypothetical protein A2046_06945 [Bacteroidetes bacterium GWA2_30_7]
MFFFNFLIKSLILTLIIVFVAIIIFYFFPELYFFNFSTIVLFILISSLVSHFFIMKAFNTPNVFIRRYMLSLTIKLLSSLVFILIVFFIDKSNALKAGLSFIFIYLIFLIFETINFLKYKNTNK